MSACVLFVLLLTAPSANAQSIVGQLGTLLTEQRSAPVFVPDVQAAVATATTVDGLFSTELSNFPLASSSGGFVYRLDPGLGVVSRVSDALGPFFTERVLRNSKGQWSVGLSFQGSEFSSLQGADLEFCYLPDQRGSTIRLNGEEAVRLKPDPTRPAEAGLHTSG